MNIYFLFRLIVWIFYLQLSYIWCSFLSVLRVTVRWIIRKIIIIRSLLKVVDLFKIVRFHFSQVKVFDARGWNFTLRISSSKIMTLVRDIVCCEVKLVVAVIASCCKLATLLLSSPCSTHIIISVVCLVTVAACVMLLLLGILCPVICVLGFLMIWMQLFIFKQ
jgi:hypothetical protein